MSNLRILRLLLTSALGLAIGCSSLTVNSLSEAVISPPPLSEPPPITLRVERLTHVDEENTTYSRRRLEEGLAEALRGTRLFSVVYSLGSREPEAASADFILRGNIRTEWGSQGAANFFTYFPGGLIFAPAWRGTRWNYKSKVELEIVDNRSDEVVGDYFVESEHELVHLSGNPPLHFILAAAVVPATIIGSGKAWVRKNYRRSVHDAAYPELWQRVAAQISADRGPSALAAVDARRERCGERFGIAPSVGELWDEFLDCQPGVYRKMGERLSSSGVAETFEDRAGHWRIYVVDGRISQWDGDSLSSWSTDR